MADKQYTEQFHKNFNRAVNQIMADLELSSLVEVADLIGVHKQSIYRILDFKQAPTVEQAITLCFKGNFNANWMFLNKGEVKMDVQVLMSDIAKALKIKAK